MRKRRMNEKELNEGHKAKGDKEKGEEKKEDTGGIERKTTRLKGMRRKVREVRV